MLTIYLQCLGPWASCFTHRPRKVYSHTGSEQGFCGGMQQLQSLPGHSPRVPFQPRGGYSVGPKHLPFIPLYSQVFLGQLDFFLQQQQQSFPLMLFLHRPSFFSTVVSTIDKSYSIARLFSYTADSVFNKGLSSLGSACMHKLWPCFKRRKFQGTILHASHK